MNIEALGELAGGPRTDPIEDALAWAEGPERPVGETPKDIHARNLAAELRRQSQELEIMNARVAVDAKSYERDQYLIAALRKQLAALNQPAQKQGD